MKNEMAPLALIAAFGIGDAYASPPGETTITLGELHIDGGAGGGQFQQTGSSVLTSVVQQHFNKLSPSHCLPRVSKAGVMAF